MTGTGPAEGAVAAEDEGEDLAALFDASESDAPSPYRICAPPLERDRPTQADLAVFHMGSFVTAPEEGGDSWEHTLSDMDVSDDASIVAVGMGDYGADTGYEVGGD